MITKKNTKARIVVLVTLDTKMSEADYLVKSISSFNITPTVIDISLSKNPSKLNKSKLISSVSKRAADYLKIIESEGSMVVVVLGGGTGLQIGIKAMQNLSPLTQRFLIGTFPQDVRPWLAKANTTLIPTIVDVCGNGPILKFFLDKAVRQIVFSAKENNPTISNEFKAIGLTSLGVTEKAVKNFLNLINSNEESVSVFHSNGYGGSGLQMAIQENWISGIIDLTTHEATRIWVKGDHIEMDDRFSENHSFSIPRVTVPGGLNFLSLGGVNTLSKTFKKRKHFIHSESFTHVCLSKKEMTILTTKLINKLNKLSRPSVLAIPMGGFSSEDRSGGAIENIELREIFRKIAKKRTNDLVEVIEYSDHISSKRFAKEVYKRFSDLKNKKGD